MTTLKEYLDTYYELSGLASEVSRKLGFVGIAVIWIFKTDLPGKSYALAPELYWAGLMIILSLALDLLQYGLGSLIWGGYWRLKEKSGVKADQEIDAPSYFNWPALSCFWGKLLSMSIAYGLLLGFLFAHVTVKP